ncbi:MAG: replication initiation protein [Alteromonadaceae bacterium]|nr:replication initiation protein [Alteromonadaceae bacterium]
MNSILDLKESEVTHSLTLTNARYSLARDEARMLFMVMRQMDGNDKNTKFEVKVSDYSAIFNVNAHEASRDVKTAINTWFGEKYVTFHLADESTKDEIATTRLRWLITVTNLPKRGSWEIELHPDILPYINDLKKSINYPLKDIVALKNNYQYRFYELFTAHKSAGEFEITVDWLRERFELESMPAYKRTANIKSRIIEPAVVNINASTPLTVSYVDILKGRKILGWKFTISGGDSIATIDPKDF